MWNRIKNFVSNNKWGVGITATAVVGTLVVGAGVAAALFFSAPALATVLGLGALGLTVSSLIGGLSLAGQIGTLAGVAAGTAGLLTAAIGGIAKWIASWFGGATVGSSSARTKGDETPSSNDDDTLTPPQEAAKRTSTVAYSAGPTDFFYGGSLFDAPRRASLGAGAAATADSAAATADSAAATADSAAAPTCRS